MVHMFSFFVEWYEDLRYQDLWSWVKFWIYNLRIVHVRNDSIRLIFLLGFVLDLLGIEFPFPPVVSLMCLLEEFSLRFKSRLFQIRVVAEVCQGLWPQVTKMRINHLASLASSNIITHFALCTWLNNCLISTQQEEEARQKAAWWEDMTKKHQVKIQTDSEVDSCILIQTIMLGTWTWCWDGNIPRESC